VAGGNELNFSGFAAKPELSSPSLTTNILRKDGNRWTIAYNRVVCQLRTTKGLHYLAHLLRNPGRVFNVIEVHRARNYAFAPKLERDAIAHAIDEYRFAPATDGHGSNGNGRPISELERSRLAVTKRIKDSVQKIRAVNPSLGRHLSLNIKTGYTCGYLLMADQPVVWLIDDGSTSREAPGTAEVLRSKSTRDDLHAART